MDRAESIRLTTVSRETSRSEARTRALADELRARHLRPYLAAVDRARPGLADHERVRIANMLRGMDLRQSETSTHAFLSHAVMCMARRATNPSEVTE